MARKRPVFGAGSIQLPGFPPNVRHSPQATAQVAAQQGGLNPMLQQLNPQQSQQYAAVNPQPQYPYSNQQFNPMNPFQQYNPQQYQQQGMGQVPQPNDQNTSLPVQYLDPSRNQPADKSPWYHYLGGPFMAAAAPNSQVGRWWNDTLWGAPPEVHPASRFTPYQQNALNYLTQGGLHGLSQTQPNFAPIANQQLERFYTQTVPSLAERFTAMGGGQRSSAFQGALGNAGRFLGNDLAAQQGQYNLQSQGNLLNMLNLGLTPQFENVLKAGGTGLIPGAANAATQVAKAYASGGLAS